MMVLSWGLVGLGELSGSVFLKDAGSPWVLLNMFQHSCSRDGPEGGRSQKSYSQQSQVSTSPATVFYTSSWGGAR